MVRITAKTIQLRWNFAKERTRLNKIHCSFLLDFLGDEVLFLEGFSEDDMLMQRYNLNGYRRGWSYGNCVKLLFGFQLVSAGVK